MPIITLNNGKKLNYENAVSPIKIALDIGLSKDMVAGCVNGKIIDIFEIIDKDTLFSIITTKDKECLNIICNSCAYILGHAIKKIWLNAKMVTYLINENKFYYDIDIDHIITQEDISEIEKIMHELVEKNSDIIRKKVSLKEARDIFIKREEHYKVSIIDENMNNNQDIIIYCHQDYVDICHNLHVPNTRFCHNFKLIKKISSFWNRRNVSKKLQRVYGIAFENKKSLNVYLNKLKEHKNRDHRTIGKQLDLFHIQKEAPGMVFWHNDGWIIFRELENFIRTKLKKYKYQEVNSPCIMERVLWEKTGHWNYYKDAIFIVSSDNRDYCIKPMNCPGHVQIFNQRIKSYRDLPIRIAEFGSCYRNEPSGALYGLMRIRSFTQDDAHIFSTEEQIIDEVDSCIKMIYDIYNTFGFKKIFVKFSTRPKKRIGNDEIWNRSENDLEIVLKKNNITFDYQIGEGAFYGPKIEFILHDYLDRAWQCGTIQLDFSLPERLNAFYIGKDNKRHVPVMIHRAILGSIERFIGILIEEFAGSFPIWLAPVQIVIINITNSHLDYVEKLTNKLKNMDFRVKADLRNEKINLKIREHTLRHVPYILICGDKEVETGKVSVRTRSGKNFNNLEINEVIKKIKKEIHNRSF